MPRPVPGGEWTANVVIFENGSISTGVQSHRFGDLSEITLGDCRYSMIPVEVQYDNEDRSVDLLHFLPELGVSYLVGSAYGMDEERKTDRYFYVDIEAVK